MLYIRLCVWGMKKHVKNTDKAICENINTSQITINEQNQLKISMRILEARYNRYDKRS